MSPKRGNFSQNLFAASKLYVYFDLVADKINSVHRKGGKMIVYCRAGMSRSAALCIAYFMKYHGMTVDDAFQNVRERRPIIHPNSGEDVSSVMARLLFNILPFGTIEIAE